MVVGLYGIYGVYNFGCEAIVRGACKFARDLYPDCKIVYFSYSQAYDAEMLKDLDLAVVPVKSDNSLVKRAVNKACRILDLEKRCLMIDTNNIIDSVDVIISIGGDIYTIPQVLREQSKYQYYNPLVDFCERVINKRKTVIVYGASVGPWGDYQKAVDYNVRALTKYKAILCREEESIEYLYSLGLNNVMFFPDPAFQVRKLTAHVTKKYIGINLSPLSLKELYGNVDDIYISKLASLLDSLYESTGITLMFIPHVLSQSEIDNDLLFMEKIKNTMRHQDHVVFADTSKGFIGLKDYLSQCYLVAAARMHCAVNAIDENVPAIFLAYSQKSVGMCKYIYGDDKYLIDLKNIEDELIAKVKDAISQHEILSRKIAVRNDEIRTYYESNVAEVKRLIQAK